VRVRVVNSDRGFEVARQQSVLDAALRACWNLPHSCKGGNCGLCKARLVSGEVHYPNGRPMGLSAAEIEAGYILLCQARARSELELELQEIRPAHAGGAARLPCRIERAIPLGHDVMRVLLRRPPAVDFAFKAGQYVDILLSDDRRRSFSIASPPHDSRLLELHVRRVAGGELTEWLFGNGGRPATALQGAAAVQGSLITIEGPQGRFFYRDAVPQPKPLLLIGGGTGIAPLLSILRHLIENGIERELILYWGVRGSRDLYADSIILQLCARAPHLRYVPVLSAPEPAWAGRTGLVHTAVLEDFDDLGACDIYTAGPPAMIEALRSEFPSRGAAVDRLYCDSFDYAADSLERQRSSAATKS
jgi:CDP-4-dehydro-6-deoxyglucose reductase